MTDMIEKVARAIYETRAATENISHSWAEVKEASSIAAMTEAKQFYLLAIMEARAAIEAIFDSETMDALKSFWEWEQDNELFPLNEEFRAVANLYAALTPTTAKGGE